MGLFQKACRRRFSLTSTSESQQALTGGSIIRGILTFAFPIFLGQVLQQFYNLADAWVIGNFADNNAFAAVSSGGNLTFLIIGLFNGIAAGGGVVISRYYGAKDISNLKAAIHTNFLFGLLASIAATALGLLLIPPMLRMMNTPQSVLPYSVQYFRIYFGGVSTIVMYNMCMSIMRALGDSRHPLYYLIISSVINVALDLLFVAVFPWGVAGAAVATVIAQGISVSLCIVQMLRNPDITLRLDMRSLKWNDKLMGQVIRQGLPAGVQNAVISLGNVAIQTNINSFGSFAMSGQGAHAKIEGFAFLSVMSMSLTLPTFVSQNLGAGNIARAKKGALFGCIVGVGAAAATGIVIYILAPQLIRLFVSAPEAVEYGTTTARIVTRFYSLLAFSHCAAGILRGCGKSTVPMVVMLSFWCVARTIYVTLILRFINEFRMIAWAYPLTWSLSSIVFAIYLIHLDWHRASQGL